MTSNIKPAWLHLSFDVLLHLFLAFEGEICLPASVARFSSLGALLLILPPSDDRTARENHQHGALTPSSPPLVPPQGATINDALCSLQGQKRKVCYYHQINTYTNAHSIYSYPFYLHQMYSYKFGLRRQEINHLSYPNSGLVFLCLNVCIILHCRAVLLFNQSTIQMFSLL